VSLVLRLEIMIIGVEGDLNLVTLLLWCLLFAFEKGGGGELQTPCKRWMM
jgi:hypothetical protein